MSVKYIDCFPKPLLDDLVAGRWLPIVGAGLSRNAIVPKGKKIPLWNELGEIIAQDIQDFLYTNPVDALSAYEHEYGRPRLIEKLIDVLLIQDARPGEVHKAFCSIPFDLVCTTNFDFLLEKQYEINSQNYTPLIDEDQLSIGLLSTNVSILKLHGDLRHPTRLVVTEKDYDQFISQYPLLATYISNLLITRTAVLLGYSLDDPDFRQIWQVVNNRLGRSRRTAYVLSVAAKSADIARFERRGVKVINLPGSKQNYGEILAAALKELQDYWREKVIPASQVKEEKPLQELSLPRDSQTRLCFFSIPLGLQSFYRDKIFPIVRETGFVPVTADDLVTPGDNVLAKIDALIERSIIVVADLSTNTIMSEVKLALNRLDPRRVLIIVGKKDQLLFDVSGLNIIQRPDVRDAYPEDFYNAIQKWFKTAAEEYLVSFRNEPMRLLKAKEYRAAVISAITLLEAYFRKKFGDCSEKNQKNMSIRNLIEEAQYNNYLKDIDIKQVYNWITIRNQAVHTAQNVTKAKAEEIVVGVNSILNSML